MHIEGGDWRLALGLLAVVWSLGAEASAVSFFSGPQQFADDFNPTQLDADGIYERQKYAHFGGTFSITTAAHANPVDGDTWTVALHDSTLFTTLGKAFIRYDGASDCMLWNGISPVYCDIHVPDDSYAVNSVLLTVRFTTLCLQEHDYALGAVLADGIAPGSPWPFRPTRFEPNVDYVGYSDNISPQLPLDTLLPDNPLPAREGGTASIRVWINDNLGCNEPLQDVEVKLTNNMTPSSGEGTLDGHSHFSTNEPPGGRYLAVSGHETLAEAKSHTIVYDTGSTEKYTVVDSVSGTTNTSGIFNARYKAGIYAGSEAIGVIASRPAASAKEPLAFDFDERPLKIQVPGLINMPKNWGSYDGTSIYKFVFGGTCAHDPEARYVTPTMYEKAVALATAYKVTYGTGLSYNDASLPFGGFFDKPTRDVKCHFSHRVGIDLDLNSHDLSGLDLHTGLRSYDGILIKGEDAVEKLANLLGMTKVDEGPIHFRSNEYFE